MHTFIQPPSARAVIYHSTFYRATASLEIGIEAATTTCIKISD